MNRSFLLSTVFLAAVFGPTVVRVPSLSRVAMAQDGVLAETYGNGVHAYFSHDYARAYELLSRAIDGGIKDPRAYYFRGLTNLATGRPDEAEGDFQVGAQLEALGNFGSLIGRSLTRIQGAERLQIERIRQQARLEQQAEAAARAQRRYSQAQQADAQALRAQPRPRTAPPIPGRRPPAPPAVPADAPSPFADEAMANGEPKVQSRDALQDALVDPFADDAAPAAPAAQPNAAAPAGADPFGGTAPAGDPFAAPPAGGADPFATPPAGGADPFATPPATGDDPFGGDPFAP